MTYSRKLTILILALCIISGLFMTACQSKEDTSNKKAKEIYTGTATITESGFSYDEVMGTVNYAVTIKNESSDYRCIGATVDVTITTATGEEVTDSFDTPEILPNTSITIGMQGYGGLKYAPTNVTYSINNSTTWEENEYPIKLLEVTSCESRYPEYEYESESDWDVDSEFAELFEGEDMSGYSAGTYSPTGMIEFYGTVTNPSSRLIDGVIVYIVYRDANGNLLGGDSTTLQSSLAQGGSVEFTVSGTTTIQYASYEAHAYAW